MRAVRPPGALWPLGKGCFQVNRPWHGQRANTAQPARMRIGGREGIGIKKASISRFLTLCAAPVKDFGHTDASPQSMTDPPRRRGIFPCHARRWAKILLNPSLRSPIRESPDCRQNGALLQATLTPAPSLRSTHSGPLTPGSAHRASACPCRAHATGHRFPYIFRPAPSWRSAGSPR